MPTRDRFDPETIAQLVERSGTREAIRRAWSVQEEIPEGKAPLKLAVRAYLADHTAQLTLKDVLDHAQTSAPADAAMVALTPEVPLLAAYESLTKHEARFVAVPTAGEVRYVGRNVLEGAVQRIRDLFPEEGGERILEMTGMYGAKGLGGGAGAVLRRSVTRAIKAYAVTVNYCYRCSGSPSHKFGAYLPLTRCPFPDEEGHVRVSLTAVSGDEC